jgi:hypothetical protein
VEFLPAEGGLLDGDNNDLRCRAGLS